MGNSPDAPPAAGLRRTNEDKQRAVRAALGHPNAAKMSDVKIAEYVGVSRMTVQRYRGSILNNVQDAPSRTVTRNGKSYEMDVSNIGKATVFEPDDEPVTPEKIAE